MCTRLLIFLFLGAFAHAVEAAPAWAGDYAALLKKYVAPEGIRYATWKRDPEDLAKLDRVVTGIAKAKTPSNRDGRLAFYIDAYNAWILHEALEKYPTKSVKDPLFLFFIQKRLTVAGEKLSFNSLEKDIIRKQFNEPRIHFVLNCASRSCPPLADRPFTGDNLERRLVEATRVFVNSPLGVRMEGRTARLSSIFNWYGEDFPEGVIPFINRYRKERIPAGAKIVFEPYDWSLNEAR